MFALVSVPTFSKFLSIYLARLDLDHLLQFSRATKSFFRLKPTLLTLRIVAFALLSGIEGKYRIGECFLVKVLHRTKKKSR